MRRVMTRDDTRVMRAAAVAPRQPIVHDRRVHATGSGEPGIDRIAPGAVHLKHYLSPDGQRMIAAVCLALGAGEADFYTPIVRGGHPMSVRMLCLGRHWNARTYTYEDVRTDIDARPAPALPPELADHAARVAREACFHFSPDLAIVNWYGPESRMGLHQDKDESAESIASGAPV